MQRNSLYLATVHLNSKNRVRRFILFHGKRHPAEIDRIVPLPETVIQELRRQIERVRLLHEENLATGYGEVYLPNALERKYPNAACEFIWQYLFPTAAFCGPPQQ